MPHFDEGKRYRVVQKDLSNLECMFVVGSGALIIPVLPCIFSLCWVMVAGEII